MATDIQSYKHTYNVGIYHIYLRNKNFVKKYLTCQQIDEKILYFLVNDLKINFVVKAFCLWFCINFRHEAQNVVQYSDNQDDREKVYL